MEFRNTQDFLKSKMSLTLRARNTHMNMFFFHNSETKKKKVYFFVRTRVVQGN